MDSTNQIKALSLAIEFGLRAVHVPPLPIRCLSSCCSGTPRMQDSNPAPLFPKHRNYAIVLNSNWKERHGRSIDSGEGHWVVLTKNGYVWPVFVAIWFNHSCCRDAIVLPAFWGEWLKGDKARAFHSFISPNSPTGSLQLTVLERLFCIYVFMCYVFIIPMIKHCHSLPIVF